MRNFIPLNAGLLEKYFKDGRADCAPGLGIYPMLPGNFTNLLAFDFDDACWLENLTALWKVCRMSGIDAILERSSSGRGGHLWIFFEQPIQASRARKLGFCLLTKAMETTPGLDFTSYDRMFPSQDVLEENGLGNLIALPLGYRAYRKDNAAFINEYGQKLEHPIENLQQIRKLLPSEAEDVIRKLDPGDYFYENDLIAMDLAEDVSRQSEIHAGENVMLVFEKKELTRHTELKLKRLASMENPEFYRQQAGRRYAGHIRRILVEYQEDREYLYLPRGLKERAEQILPETSIHWTDRRAEGTAIEAEFARTLYEDQEKAVNQLLKHDTGVLEAPPGFGKTVLALYVIAFRKVSTMIIVPSIELMRQWKTRIEYFLELPESTRKDPYVRTCSGTSKKFSGHIDIAVIDSLNRMEVPARRKLFQNYGLVLVDECHRAAADKYTSVLKDVSSRYLYGFSATPKRGDGLSKIMFMYLGDLVCKVDLSRLRQNYQFTQSLIFRTTSFFSLEEDQGWSTLLNDLAKDPARNQLIFQDVRRLYDEGRKIILLSERKDHLQNLYTMLSQITSHVYLLTGSVKTKERKAALEQVRDMQEPYILLATSSLLGEGFDLPALDTLFLTMPVSDWNRITQYTGRIHRNFPGKKAVEVYDYVDAGIPQFQASFRKRLKAYKAAGYIVKNQAPDPVEVSRVLFEDPAWKEPFLSDLDGASQEILLFFSTVKDSCLRRYEKSLRTQVHRGVRIYVIVSEPLNQESAEFRRILGTGAKVLVRKHNLSAVIMDRKLNWLFNFNLLAASSKKPAVIRYEDPELAAELFQSLKKDGPATENPAVWQESIL